ncbi:peptidylprolyl isomerase [Mangrovimonas futianensis]|uniref:peptidylprolyl isomerase n=1 Tax=Mangrovimonas futianensis TaxID=2895523 RepID=UPI001E4EBB1E|nr:peptidylprolyl isomerase [Mangrovimonas futianensis]MCF1420301.1 SurA N-terminal domain-containing protein [Mangrovimonas futianensis]
MAVLNKIRKQGLFLIIIIALALFSFVIGDLFRSGSSLWNRNQDVVATINGKEINRVDFMQKVEAAQRQLGPNGTTTQAMNRVFDQEVRQAVLETQFEELGFTVEKDQMRDILKSNLANNPNFQNEAGLFDENKLNEYIANLKETSAAAYQQWVDYENSMATSALQQDYFNMVKAGMSGTLAEGKLEHLMEGEKVDLKFVQIPYTSIADSTITVSNSEISDYIKKHKKQYEVDATRDIRYVEFRETPTAADEEAIKGVLKAMLNDKVEYSEVTKTTDTIRGFLHAANIEAFVNSNSDLKYNDQFVFRNSMLESTADSLFKLNVGEVYGPYKDGNYYKLSKIVAEKNLPDSAQARHILIPFVGAASTQPDVTQTEEEAKATADSLLTVLKGDRSKFETFVTEFSSDQGSVANGGRYEYFPYNRMVPEFRDFVFENETGSMGVVKSAYGFHLIEVEGHKNVQRVIKVATIAREIEASEETIDQVFRNASNFEIALEKGEFTQVAKESDYAVKPVNGIKILDENIPGLGSQRAIVRWAFEETTEVGKSKRFSIPNGFAIVQLTAKHAEGLMNVEQASVTALPAIRKEKKAKQIKERISASTLQDVASAENTSVRSAMAVSMSNPTITGAGREPLVVGTAFGLNEGETSGLIEGEKGVFMVEVTKKTPAVELENYQSYANRVGASKVNTVNSKLYEALKEVSTIEDNRAETVQ